MEWIIGRWNTTIPTEASAMNVTYPIHPKSKWVGFAASRTRVAVIPTCLSATQIGLYNFHGTVYSQYNCDCLVFTW